MTMPLRIPQNYMALPVYTSDPDGRTEVERYYGWLLCEVGLVEQWLKDHPAPKPERVKRSRKALTPTPTEK